MTERRGRIVKGIGGFYYVSGSDGTLYECRARGIFRKDGIKPLVGDEVVISVAEGAAEGSVEEILPRRNALLRPEAANVDQALIVFACSSPEPNPVLLDRFLIMLRRQELPCLLLWNKKDLVKAERIEELCAAYQGAEVKVRCGSARDAEELETLREELHGRTTILAGPSGVGKSTILNALCPQAAMETGEISAKLRRGRHTTRHAELFAMDTASYLMDTPGFTALELVGVEAEEVKAYYPEFYPYEGACRFQPCTHLHEPDCAVRAAVETGAIAPQRYRSYQTIYREQKERRRY